MVQAKIDAVRDPPAKRSYDDFRSGSENTLAPVARAVVQKNAFAAMMSAAKQVEEKKLLGPVNFGDWLGFLHKAK